MTLRSAAAVLTGTAMLTAAAACGDGSVPVSVPTEFGAAAVCRELAWPVSLGELVARKTSPSDPAIAAWGDPPVIARCGLAPLAPTTLECLSVNGIDWVIRPLDDGTAFATYGRDPAIEVLIPRAYAPEPMLLTDFTDVARSLPTTDRACVTRSPGP
ncbi:MAG: DUF3515 family protein [Nostocoides sp.]|uniref:DUF3515 family protein n=1 Tax=Nostocoides sp. TaxID=1917966 RepID=UPI003C70E3B0